MEKKSEVLFQIDRKHCVIGSKEQPFSIVRERTVGGNTTCIYSCDRLGLRIKDPYPARSRSKNIPVFIDLKAIEQTLLSFFSNEFCYIVEQILVIDLTGPYNIILVPNGMFLVRNGYV